MPSYTEIHWAVTSMVNAHSVNGVMWNVDVAYFPSIEGNPNDLLTFPTNPTSWAWALCEYNCQTLPTTITLPTATGLPATLTPPPTWLTPVDCSTYNDRLGYRIGNRRYDVAGEHYHGNHIPWQTAYDDCALRGGSLAVTGMSSLATRL